MPAGLDGNPAPFVTPERDAVLGHLAHKVGSIIADRRLVGIDGASGSGKSTLGDELAARLRQRGHYVVRSTVDSFHRPRVERMRRGPTSPDGYYLDSHQLGTVVTDLLRPFRQGAARARTAAFDEPSDSPIDEWLDRVPHQAILVFDGLFLLRPELRSYWDFTVHLTAEGRLATQWDRYLSDDLPEDPVERQGEIDQRLGRARWPRYQHGWQRYLDDADPVAQASIVIDNDDLRHPRLSRPAPP